MSLTSTLISGGTVVSAGGAFKADVLIRGERIAAVGSGEEWQADRLIDASGKYVVPGGVDVHTHLEEPMDFRTRTADDFLSGTTGAAFGGTTTIVDFAKRHPDADFRTSFERRLELAAGKPVIDYGFHVMVTAAGLGETGLDELRALADEGATSIKLFMAYRGRMMVEDETILAAMRLAAELGLIVMIHAENGAIVDDATRRLIDAGETAEHMHLSAHPAIAEREAAHRAIALAELTGCPLYIVHVSSASAAEEIAIARGRAVDVWGETCPQYLFAAYEDYRDLGYEAAKFVCSPPIRERANQQPLWRALESGALSTVGTDHASFCIGERDDLPPQKSRGRGYFPEIPNGVPGIEERLVLTFQGVTQGHFGVSRFVDLVSTRPAKLFGLYPRKGVIAPGSDADLVVWDPDAEHVIEAARQHTAVDYTLYEGLRVVGKPTHVLSRGDVIVEGDQLLAEPGRGRYLERGTVLTT